MTFEEKRVNIPIDGSGWMRCPRCRKRIFKPLPDTSGKNIPVPCHGCRVSWITEIKQPEPNEAR